MNTKTKIKIPVMIFGGYLYQTKDATIDVEKKTITTLRTKKGEEEGELYTQPYYDVGRYEWFSAGRYLLPFILIVTADMSLTVKNGFGLFFGALFIFVYHHYLRGYASGSIDQTEKEGFFEGLFQNVKNIWVIGKPYLALMGYFIALNILFFPVDGGSYYVKGIVEYTIYMVMIYESTRSFVSKEWTQYKKVKVNSWIPQYFTVIDTAEAKTRNKLIDQKLAGKVNMAVLGTLAVSVLFLMYKGVYAYKEYKAEQAATAQYVQQSNLDAMKLQSERNGSAQIVIRYEQVKLDAKTQALHDKLEMKPEYKEVKQITYPWEKGYQRGGTFVFNPTDTAPTYSNGGSR